MTVHPHQFEYVTRDKDGKFTYAYPGLPTGKLPPGVHMHMGRDLDMSSVLKETVAMNLVNELKKKLGLRGQGAVAFFTDDGAGGIEVILPSGNGEPAKTYDLLDVLLSKKDSEETELAYEPGWYQDERGQLFQFTGLAWKPPVSDQVAATLEKLG